MSRYAKLVRGTTYYLGKKLFEAGKKVEITDAEYDLLTDDTPGEAHGYDRIEVEGREELRSKFEFSESAEGTVEPEEAKPITRTRTRKPDTAA